MTPSRLALVLALLIPLAAPLALAAEPTALSAPSAAAEATPALAVTPALAATPAWEATRAFEPTPAAQPTPTPAAGIAPAEHVLHVHVVRLRNSLGRVGCTLYNQPATFPEDSAKALRDIDVPIKDGAAWCNFPAIPAGTYAMVVIHDENGNGKFDEDALGMPLEGYAFSNNVRATIAPPTFAKASFTYRGGEQWLTITMTY